MSSVDDRIVNMQFNSDQFTKGAAASKKSLDDLNGAVGNAAKSKGLNDLADGVDQVKNRFSAMEIAGVTAVATIANKAVNAGIKLIKSFTLDPLKQGFGEYQTNLKSTQTIIANTGLTSAKGFGQIKKSLDELNAYSDSTIYDFSQMASSIGKFTAAGVGLKESTAAIKGMANSAALGGASIEQMNTAMYQVSQALASGTIRLMDWNSVVNANMGGKNMQTAIIQTALSMKKLGAESVTLGKNITINSKSFRESLQSGWLSADVYTKTMKVMAGQQKMVTDQFGFTKKATVAYSVAQLKSMGYTEEQAKSLNKLSQSAIDSAQDIRTLPQMIDVIQEGLGSVWASLFEGLIGNIKQSTRVFTTFGLFIGDHIGEISDGAKNFLKVFNTVPGGGRIGIFVGIMNGLRAVNRVMHVVGDAFSEVFSGNEMAKSLGAMTLSFRHFMGSLIPSVDTMAKMKSVFAGFFAVLHIGFTIFKAVASLFTGFFGEILKNSGSSTGGLLKFAASIGEMLVNADKFISSGGKLVDLFHNIGQAAGSLVGQGLSIASNVIFGIINGLVGGAAIAQLKTAVMGVGTNIIEWVKGVLGIHSPAQTMIPIGQNIIAGIAQGIAAAIHSLTGLIAVVGKSIIDGFNNILKGVLPGTVGVIGTIAHGIVGAFKAVFGSIFAGTDALGLASLFNALLTGTILLTIRKFVSGTLGNFNKAQKAFKQTMKEFTSTLQTFQTSLKASALKALAVAIFILVTSLIALQFIDPKKIGIGIGAIGSLMTILVGAFAVMDKIGSKVDDKGKSLATSAGKINGMAAAILIMANAMLIMTAAVTVLAQQDPVKVGAGITAMAIAMGIMLGALKSISKIGALAEGSAATFFVLASSMLILATAVSAFGHMSLKTLGKGLGAMGITIAILVSAMTEMSFLNPKTVFTAGAIVALAGAMVVMAGAVAVFGHMGWKTLTKGLIAMGFAMEILVGGLTELSFIAPEAAIGAGAMLGIATAMVIMSKAIQILGGMSLGDLVKGIGAMGFAMAVFGGIASAFTEVVPVILAFGAAMALAGGGMLAFSTGLALLATLGGAGIAAITAIFSAFIGLLPALAAQVAASIVEFVKVIGAAAPQIFQQVVKIVGSFLEALGQLVPKVGALIGVVIKTIFKVIRTYAGEIIDTGLFIVEKLLKGIQDNVGKLASSALGAVLAFVNAVASPYNIALLVGAAVQLILNFIDGIATWLDDTKNIDKVINSSEHLGEAMGKAMGHGIEKTAKDALSKLNPYNWFGGSSSAFVDGVAKDITDAIKKRRSGPDAPSDDPPVKGQKAGILRPGTQGDSNSRLGGPQYGVLSMGAKAKPKLLPTQPAFWAKAIGKGFAATAKTTGGKLGATLLAANQLFSGRGTDKATKLTQAAETAARQSQINAALAQAKATATARAAAKLPAITKKNKNSADSKRKRALQAAADKQQKAADAAQASADAAKQRAQDALDFKNADTQGRADIRKQQAEDKSQLALNALTRANAEAARAKELMKTNKKAGQALLAQAKKDAQAAANYSAAASADLNESVALYAKTVTDRITQIQKDRADYAKSVADEAAYNAADDKGKIDILNQRALADQAVADARNKDADALIKQAQALAKTDAAAANLLLDKAEQAASDAQAAADKAKQEKDQATDLANQTAQAVSDAAANVLTPSRSVLDNAALSVDSYTASMQAAQEAAAATPAAPQYNQYNYSPAALSASDVYRQTKTLLAAADV